MTEQHISAEIERIARHWIENGRTDAFGNPDPGDWEHIKANKPIAHSQAIRVATWALSIPPAPQTNVLGSEPIGYCVWITPTKLAACAKSARGAFPVYAKPAAPSEFCGCMAGPNDPDPNCRACGGTGRGSPPPQSNTAE